MWYWKTQNLPQNIESLRFFSTCRAACLDIDKMNLGERIEIRLIQIPESSEKCILIPLSPAIELYTKYLNIPVTYVNGKAHPSVQLFPQERHEQIKSAIISYGGY